jgi:Fe-S-cluster containining protein
MELESESLKSWLYKHYGFFGYEKIMRRMANPVIIDKGLWNAKTGEARLMDDDLLPMYRQVIAALDANVAGLHEEFRHHMQCRNGCSSCCENARFKIRYIEAVTLLMGFSFLPDVQKQRILDQLQSPEARAKNDCPLLLDGSCSLYEYRPSLCRAYGVIVQIGEQVASCPLNFQERIPGESLKKLNLLPYYELLDELSRKLWAQSTPDPETAPPYQTIREFLTQALIAE